MRLRFHAGDNDQLICYSKRAAGNTIVVVVNLDPHNAQAGFVQLPIQEWGFKARDQYELHDLLNGHVYCWKGAQNRVTLDPAGAQARILRLTTGRES